MCGIIHQIYIKKIYFENYDTEKITLESKLAFKLQNMQKYAT